MGSFEVTAAVSLRLLWLPSDSQVYHLLEEPTSQGHELESLGQIGAKTQLSIAVEMRV